MADNVTLPGTGIVVLADEVTDATLGTGKIQYVKLMNGALDATDKVGGDATNGLDVDVTRIAAGETHLGEVGGKLNLVQVTFSLDSSGSYAAGDLLADAQIITACMRVNAGSGYLQSISLNDKDDQGQPMDVYITQSSGSFGTENSAPNISDTTADSILGFFSIAAADYKDLGGCKVANIRNIGMPVVAAGGVDDLYVALITQGTPTHTASGITAWFGFDCN